MTVRHMLIAVLVASIWGGAIIAAKIGLESFTPSELVALRFLVAALPIFFVARPTLRPGQLLAIGMTLFAGQFLLLFIGFEFGMPPGVASVTQQTQAFFTMCLATLFLGESPGLRHWCGMLVSMAGLALVASSIDADLTATGLAFALAGAMSWAVGNILLKSAGPVSMPRLVIWLSVVPPLPALLLSAAIDDGGGLLDAIAQASWRSIAAAIYMGIFATVVGYALWGRLLSIYRASDVAPFSLLVPITGVVGSHFMFGEVFGLVRGAGLLLVMGGFALAVMPARWLPAFLR